MNTPKNGMPAAHDACECDRMEHGLAHECSWWLRLQDIALARRASQHATGELHRHMKLSLLGNTGCTGTGRAAKHNINPVVDG